MMKSSIGMRWAAVVVAALLTSTTERASAALTFDTIVFQDGFEGFTAGTDLVGGTTPSGTGFIWQQIAGAGNEGTISNAQAFTGSNSLALTRPGRFPRYWTFPNFVPEANIAANTLFGIQYDLNLGTNGTTLAVAQIGLAPGGAVDSAGEILTTADGSIFVNNGGLVDSGADAGLGWQTLEIVHALGPDVAGSAADLVTIYLTRHAGNSAGVLPRTQIYQYTDALPIGSNYRVDLSNGSNGTFYIDNITLGTLVPIPEPASLALAALGLGLALACRRRS